MDELLIGDKKYISSKRAAKATGYAKDYIGQLCREGRVPARLVGRSWYVLESAIHDHRFGEERIEREPKAISSEESLIHTWESPRYESTPIEILPAVNKLMEEERSTPPEDQEDTLEVPTTSESVSEASTHLQDAWKAWFDRVATEEETTAPQVSLQEREGEASTSQEERDSSPEEVPIRFHAVYSQPPQELLPHHAHKILRQEQEEGEDAEEETVQILESQGHGGSKLPMRILRSIELTGAVCAILFVTMAVLSTGYFDKYIASNRQASMLAGIVMYNK